MSEFLVKVRGESKGPYTTAQLQTQIRRKRLSRQHQVSADGGVLWQRAGDVDALFPPTVATQTVQQTAPVDGAASGAAAGTGPSTSFPNANVGGSGSEAVATAAIDPAGAAEKPWSYAVMGQQLGPVPESEIRILIASGGITPDTLLWQTGMTDWVEVQHIPTFSTAIRSAQSGRGSQPSAEANLFAQSSPCKSLHWPSVVALLTTMSGWAVLLPGGMLSLSVTGAIRVGFSRADPNNVMALLFLVSLALSPSLLFTVIGINLGHKALRFSGKEPGKYEGTVYAIFSLILGYLTALAMFGLTISCIVSVSR